jgi:glutamyl-tRNA synthetase
MATDKTARVRYAPSPTGYLHVGTLRSALFNWLFARHHGGTFILRIEDTDRTRYVEDSLADILGGLRWLGLDWDEGPEVGGDYGPYFQSERREIYQEYARQLIAGGHAYKCYCRPQRLQELRREQRARKEPPGYDRHCRYLTARQRAELEAQGLPYVVRLAVPLTGQTGFHDAIYGDITFENANLDDLVLLKSDGFPTYHLANVVDDHLMEISHIMRADEWLPSVPKHVLLYRAFGWEPPTFAHLPLILDPRGKGKMSKRKTVDGSGLERPVMVRDFRQAGYLPEALFNFLLLLGWSYDDKTEIFSRQEAIAYFDLERVNKSPAAFSYDKLERLNGLYIRALSPPELAERLIPFLAAGLDLSAQEVRARPETAAVVPLIQERIKTLQDATPLVDFLYHDALDYAPDLLIGKKMTAGESLAALRAVRESLQGLAAFEEETLETNLRALAKRLGLKAGSIFGIIRVAITGKKVAPPLFGSLAILGRERAMSRLDAAIAMLESLAAPEPDATLVP